MANIGLILTRSPFAGQNMETLYHIASSALKKKHKVFVYLCFDGVISPVKNQRAIEDERLSREMLGDLLQKGANIVCSNLDIRLRGLESKSLIDSIKTGGLPDVAEAFATMDRVISL